jgi:hypothetical protein
MSMEGGDGSDSRGDGRDHANLRSPIAPCGPDRSKEKALQEATKTADTISWCWSERIFSYVEVRISL